MVHLPQINRDEHIKNIWVAKNPEVSLLLKLHVFQVTNAGSSNCLETSRSWKPTGSTLESIESRASGWGFDHIPKALVLRKTLLDHMNMYIYIYRQVYTYYWLLRILVKFELPPPPPKNRPGLEIWHPSRSLGRIQHQCKNNSLAMPYLDMFGRIPLLPPQLVKEIHHTTRLPFRPFTYFCLRVGFNWHWILGNVTISISGALQLGRDWFVFL